jgi:hypothetical protein
MWRQGKTCPSRFRIIICFIFLFLTVFVARAFFRREQRQLNDLI